MRILLTGHDGYIGHVLTPLLQEAGHEVTGLDVGLFAGCGLVRPPALRVPEIVKDIREIAVHDLEGFDAVLHLAGLSNDPLGDLAPEITYDVNHRAAVRLAVLAKAAGVPRFVFSSSCSNYGAQGDAILDEEAALKPVTPYAESKVWVERDLAPMADDRFSPTFLRSGTAYGVSRRLRGDLVVNNLVGYAITTGRILIKSDGSAWRPLVHIEDIARAFKAVAEAPRERVHNQAFNVGRQGENYRVREVADIVKALIPEAAISYGGDGGRDPRNYQVSVEKLHAAVPAFQPVWTVAEGVRELRHAFQEAALTEEAFLSSSFMRLKRVLELQTQGLLDRDLRWRRVA